MAACLPALPPELLEVIAGFRIKPKHGVSLLQLRSTSRTIQSATRRTWLNEFFYTRKVVLEPGKLTELMELGEVPELAKAVDTIQVFCGESTDLQDSGFEGLSVPLAQMKCASMLTLAF